MSATTPELPDLSLEPVEPSAAARLAARAFGDDPMFEHILPKARSRTRLLPRLLEASFRMDLRHGAALVGARSGGKLAGVALWHPRAAADPPWWSWLREAGLLAPVLARPAAGRRALKMISELGRQRPHDGSRSYLRILAVDPGFQRRGIGGVLLEDVLGRSRLLNRKVYLETFREANLDYYARFGFRVVSSSRLPGRPVFWSLET